MAKIYKAKAMEKPTKIRTGKCRLSYPHLFEKYEKSGKYSCRLIFDKKSDTASVAMAAIAAAKEDGKARLWAGKVPGSYSSPLYDGDTQEEPRPEYANSYYLTAKSTQRPGVVDLSCVDILDSEELYPGCYVRATLTFFPYSNDGKGVGVILNNIQKLDEGERLGGSRASAEDDFADDEDDVDELLD